jgi:hypothetical protein
MKVFAIRNKTQGKFVSCIRKNQAQLVYHFQYARMYYRRADASRLANMLNTKGRDIFNIVEIMVTEKAPGKRKAKRVSKRAFKRSSKR